MKRRDFVEKSGCGLLGMALAYFGLTSCKKKEEAPATEPVAPAHAEEAVVEMNQKDTIKKLLMEQMGKTDEEAAAMIAEFEEKLALVEGMCICRTCPSYVPEETEKTFCHALVGQSKVITQEKGCDCPKCPVHKDMGLKNGYYCTRKSELEQEAAKAV
ncbi:MAG TPA: DUF2769 domain-containing protein [Candidatus Desulfaltia sp.]|nr:DUF2769 domain-containing protein [Candidatus Desulfaltia sp.]